MKRIAAIGLLAVTVSAACQQSERESLVSVLDRSRRGSPLLVTGDVTARDRPTQKLRFSVEGRVSLTNISSKPILLTVVSLVGTNVEGVNDTWSQDYYFSEPLEPHAVENREWTFGPFVSRAEVKSNEGSKWIDLEPEPSAQQRVTAKVLFVQFTDGSTWGDPEKAQSALKERDDNIKRLVALERIYRREGEKAFIDELSKPTFLTAVGSVQHFCKNTKDKNKVVELLLRMRAASDGHERMLKSAVAEKNPHPK